MGYYCPTKKTKTTIYSRGVIMSFAHKDRKENHTFGSSSVNSVTTAVAAGGSAGKAVATASVTASAAAGSRQPQAHLQPAKLKFNMAYAESAVTLPVKLHPSNMEQKAGAVIIHIMGKGNKSFNFDPSKPNNQKLTEEEKFKSSNWGIRQKVVFNKNYYLIEYADQMGSRFLFLLPEKNLAEFSKKHQIPMANILEKFPDVILFNMAEIPARQVQPYKFAIPKENFLLLKLSAHQIGIFELINNKIVQKKIIEFKEEINGVHRLRLNQIAITFPITRLESWNAYIKIFDFNDMLNADILVPLKTIPISHPDIAEIDHVYLHNDGNTLICVTPLFSRRFYNILSCMPNMRPLDAFDQNRSGILLVDMTHERILNLFKVYQPHRHLIQLLADGKLCLFTRTHPDLPSQLTTWVFPEPQAKVTQTSQEVRKVLVSKDLARIVVGYLGIFANRSELDDEISREARVVAKDSEEKSLSMFKDR